MEELSRPGINFADFMSVTENERTETDLKDPLWEKYDLEEQYLHNQDGSIVNLSGIDLNSFTIYEFDAGNSSEITYDILSTSRTVVLTIFAVIFLVGLTGNALVIYTVSRYVTMRRITYLYLLNLSVADIMYLVVCLPTLSVSYALVDWRFGRIFCKLQNYVMSVSMSVSVLSIVATGLDRYYAVIHPLGARTHRTVKRAASVILLTWIFSLAVMAPRMILFDEISTWHITGMITLCSRVYTEQVLQIDTSLNFVIMYLLPLAVLSFCHSRIGQRLWTSKRPGNSQARNGQLRMLLVHHKRRIAKMIFMVTIIFAIGWLPIHVYHLVEDFDKGHILFASIVDRGTIALVFSFAANSLNPIIYCMFSSNFRKHFVKAIRCWGPRINPSINGEDLGILGNPVTVEIQLENSRPPPVLLPRPASLLTDSASYLETDPVYVGRRTQLASEDILSLQPLIHGMPRLSSCSDSSPTCSSISVKTVAQIEVSPPQLPPGSVCLQEQDSNPLLSPSPQDTVQSTSGVPGCSYTNAQRSMSSSRTRRAHSFSNRQRPRSYDSCRYDQDMSGTLNSWQENVTTPDVFYSSHINISYGKQDSLVEMEAHCSDDKATAYQQNQGQRPLTPEDQNAGTPFNIFPSPESSSNASLATKHTLLQTIERHMDMASSSHIDDHVQSLANSSYNDHSSRKRTIQVASVSKLPRSQTVSSFHEPTTSRLNAESQSNIKQTTSSSSSTSTSLRRSLKYHPEVQGGLSNAINYVGCKYKDKSLRIETDLCLPPVD